MNERRPRARPVFRWLAAIVAAVCVVMAVVMALGLLNANGQADFVVATLFGSGAFMFGSIAATGKFESSVNKPFKLFVVAKQYTDEEITLEEYGMRTKEIMQGR